MRTPLRILVAEDELGDVYLIQRAFARAGVNVPVHFARNGQEVLDYLEGNPPFENPVEFPLPNLLLLDLNLPRLSGFEVLTWVRGKPAFSQMPVVVLSSSDRREEISKAYQLGANSYVIKPTEPTELISVVERIQNYWLGINAPPARALVGPAVSRLAGLELPEDKGSGDATPGL